MKRDEEEQRIWAAGGEHHEAIPNHNPIRTGTRCGILKSGATHHRLTVEELVRKLEL